MAANQRSTSATGTGEKTYFEQQREALIGEVAMVRNRPFLVLPAERTPLQRDLSR